MNQLYRATGISKQGFHQHTERYLGMREEQEQILLLIAEIRRDHPRMSARVMYGMIKPECLGRDRFEEFCFSHGLKIERKRAYHRTTDSRGVTLKVRRTGLGIWRAWKGFDPHLKPKVLIPEAML